MVHEIKVNVLHVIIIIAVIFLLLLFWVYVRNTRRITSMVDKKTTLAKVVLTLSHVLANLEGSQINTPASQTPALAALLNALESSVLKLDTGAGSSGHTYLFIYDTSGNKIVDSDDSDRGKKNRDSDGGGVGARVSGNEFRPQKALIRPDVPIDRIIKTAGNGGGFVEFPVTDFQTGKKGKKVAYVRMVAGTHWVVGAAMHV